MIPANHIKILGGLIISKQNTKLELKISTIAILILLLTSTLSTVTSETIAKSNCFTLDYGLTNYSITVSVPNSLLKYYQSLDRTVVDENDFTRFVTPEVFVSLATQIRDCIGVKNRCDELFANAVLSFVHQIRYDDNVNETKFPIETIIDDAGKCDTMSFLAASIMRAGGLDVVLLYFKDVHHVTIGVHLPYDPYVTWLWQGAAGFEFEGKKYWVGECTPKWDWRVGDLPPLLVEQNPTIIPIENFEESIGQVSSQLGMPLNSSMISVDVSFDYSNLTNWSREFTIFGSIVPSLPNQTIICYFSQNGSNYYTQKALTDQHGVYSLVWNPNSTGTFFVRASWSGNSDFVGADSEMVSFFFGVPNYLLGFDDLDGVLVYSHPVFHNFLLDDICGVESFFMSHVDGSAVILSGEFRLFNVSEGPGFIGDGRPVLFVDAIPSSLSLYPFELPRDLGESTNDHLGFIIKKSGENNFTLDVKGLDSVDISQFYSSIEEEIVVLDMSNQVREDVWYSIEIGMSKDQVNLEFGMKMKCWLATWKLLVNLLLMNFYWY